MIVKRYRKKPVEILAMEWTGDNKVDVQRFVGRYLDLLPRGLKIPTLEGDMFASVGDYIIQGVNGEFYPCKPDVFAKTYEPAESAADVVPVVPELQKTVKLLHKEYGKAKKNPVVRDPLAYALYQVWKKADEREVRHE